jgi:hypothetical protein
MKAPDDTDKALTPLTKSDNDLPKRHCRSLVVLCEICAVCELCVCFTLACRDASRREPKSRSLAALGMTKGFARDDKGASLAMTKRLPLGMTLALHAE